MLPTAKRLLFLINDLNFFVTHRLPLAKGAVELGYQVHIAGPDTKPLPKELAVGEYKKYSVQFSKSRFNPFLEISTLVQIVCLIRKTRPDILHLVTVKPNIYGGCIARLMRVPGVILSVSGLGHVFLAKGFAARVRKHLVIKLYRFALQHKNSRVIFQNDADADVFISHKILTHQQVVMIRGSGVDTNLFSPTAEPPGDPIVLFAARLLREKGISEWIEAVRTLKNKNLKFQAVIVGAVDNKNPSSVSETEVTEWQNSGLIKWQGHRKDMERVYAESHIVCLPSYREGLPKTLLEAGACGRPSITTDVAGCRDVITDGYNGLIVPAANSIKLADAMFQLIHSAQLRQTLGQNAREHVLKYFKVEATVLETVKLYQSVSKPA